MEELGVFWKVLLGIAGALVTIGGATAVISKWISPFKNLVNRVDRLEERCEVLEKHENNFDESSQSLKTGIDFTCKCLLAIIDHELDGNNTDALKKIKDEMYDYIIDRK